VAHVGLHLYASDESHHPTPFDGKEGMIMVTLHLSLEHLDNYNRDYNQNILDFDF
jgi:hypothetical protein